MLVGIVSIFLDVQDVRPRQEVINVPDSFPIGCAGKRGSLDRGHCSTLIVDQIAILVNECDPTG